MYPQSRALQIEPSCRQTFENETLSSKTHRKNTEIVWGEFYKNLSSPLNFQRLHKITKNSLDETSCGHPCFIGVYLTFVRVFQTARDSERMLTNLASYLMGYLEPAAPAAAPVDEVAQRLGAPAAKSASGATAPAPHRNPSTDSDDDDWLLVDATS